VQDLGGGDPGGSRTHDADGAFHERQTYSRVT
jgi:hypothetical protein